MRTAVLPSLACSDYLNLGKDIEILDRVGISGYHIDIMDGHFVSNYCLNFDYLRAVKSITDTPCDVHLMTVNVERDSALCLEAGADSICFHVECGCQNIETLLGRIKNCGVKAGLAINPRSPISMLNPFLPIVDYVLIMAVPPGFSGQSFISSVHEKILGLSDLRKKTGMEFGIVVDGGISSDNATKCVEEGADALVAGALCIFSGKRGLAEDARHFMELLEG